jgi:hypothetical protein
MVAIEIEAGKFIKWTNDNCGFLSLIIFVVTVIIGWMSGFFKSIITKPKLSIRFIDKSCFHTFFYTGNKYYNKQLDETFELHKTGFAVYCSIANIGNLPTSIDKIYLGYYKNLPDRKFWRKRIQWLAQWHIFENFKIKYGDQIVMLPPLRSRNSEYPGGGENYLAIGGSIIGVAYFEQDEAWGNLNPETINDKGDIKVILKIRDIRKAEYRFKTTLKRLSIKEAREINGNFGNVSPIV